MIKQMTNAGGMQGKLDTSDQKKPKDKATTKEEGIRVTSVPHNGREDRQRSSDDSPEAIREKRVENIGKQMQQQRDNDAQSGSHKRNGSGRQKNGHVDEDVVEMQQRRKARRP